MDNIDDKNIGFKIVTFVFMVIMAAAFSSKIPCMAIVFVVFAGILYARKRDNPTARVIAIGAFTGIVLAIISKL